MHCLLLLHTAALAPLRPCPAYAIILPIDIIFSRMYFIVTYYLKDSVTHLLAANCQLRKEPILPLSKTVLKTKKNILFMVCLLFALCGIHLYWSNTTFGVTRYTIADDTLPPALQGFTIVQISDLHNTAFGEQQSQLLEATAQQQPDIIAITGDFIDSYHTDISISMEFIHRAAAHCAHLLCARQSRIPLAGTIRPA